MNLNYLEKDDSKMKVKRNCLYLMIKYRSYENVFLFIFSAIFRLHNA